MSVRHCCSVAFHHWFAGHVPHVPDDDEDERDDDTELDRDEEALDADDEEPEWDDDDPECDELESDADELEDELPLRQSIKHVSHVSSTQYAGKEPENPPRH